MDIKIPDREFYLGYIGAIEDNNLLEFISEFWVEKNSKSVVYRYNEIYKAIDKSFTKNIHKCSNRIPVEFTIRNCTEASYEFIDGIPHLNDYSSFTHEFMDFVKSISDFDRIDSIQELYEKSPEEIFDCLCACIIDKYTDMLKDAGFAVYNLTKVEVADRLLFPDVDHSWQNHYTMDVSLNNINYRWS